MDKYMRAAKAALRYIKEKGYCGVVENPYSSLTIAGLVKEELERPEPLIPGVRYRNTEANRGRLPFPLGSNLHSKLIIVGYGDTVTVAVCVDLHDDFWAGINQRPEWFALIPDGELRDE